MTATSTVKTLSYWIVYPDKQYKLRSACSLRIGVIRVYTIAIPSLDCRRFANNRLNIVGQGSAVLAAGTGLKLSDFWGYLF